MVEPALLSSRARDGGLHRACFGDGAREEDHVVTTPFHRLVGNIAFPEENRERRAKALMLALALIAMGCGIRRMLGLSEATREDNETMLKEMKRWQDDLSW